MRQEQKLMVGIDQFTLKIYCNTSSSWKTMAKQVIDHFKLNDKAFVYNEKNKMYIPTDISIVE